MSSDYVLERLDRIEAKLDLHCENHPLVDHDHLMDREDHLAHHKEIDKPKENRVGERRSAERRTSEEKYEGEERRVA